MASMVPTPLVKLDLQASKQRLRTKKKKLLLLHKPMIPRGCPQAVASEEIPGCTEVVRW
jgi:hypothetical protein